MRLARGRSLLASWLAIAAGTLLLAAPGPAPPPTVLAAQVDTIIHPVSAEFIIDTLRRADAEHASLVVLTLQTPGGLVDSTREIIAAMIASRVPVAVFVGPSGARAASAGFLITIAADVAAMAPGTHIGAAHPVSGQGEKMDETTAAKAASDLAAYARTLAARRGRNVDLAEQAVKQSRAFTEDEALKAQPPLIDLIVPDVAALLAQLDGRTVKRFDGQAVVLHTAGARVVSIEMSTRQRILSAIAHPNVAYILLSLGVLGLTVELWSPGAVLPGIAGGICLLLAFFSFQVLPVNYVGVLLILFGLVLLVLEVKVASWGLLAVGGLLSLVLGSMILIDTPSPELQVSLSLIVPVTLAIAAIVLFLVRLAVASQRRPAVTGTQGMIGEQARVLAAIPANATGRVQAHGEIWNATAPEAVAEGETVRVVAVDGLVLTVRRDAGQRRPPAPGERP